MCVYIYIYIYSTSQEKGREKGPGTLFGLGARAAGAEERARVRPVLKGSIWKKWAQPLGDLTFKGHVEVNINQRLWGSETLKLRICESK